MKFNIHNHVYYFMRIQNISHPDKTLGSPPLMTHMMNASSDIHEFIM